MLRKFICKRRKSAFSSGSGSLQDPVLPRMRGENAWVTNPTLEMVSSHRATNYATCASRLRQVRLLEITANKGVAVRGSSPRIRETISSSLQAP